MSFSCGPHPHLPKSPGFTERPPSGASQPQSHRRSFDKRLHPAAQEALPPPCSPAAAPQLLLGVGLGGQRNQEPAGERLSWVNKGGPACDPPTGAKQFQRRHTGTGSRNNQVCFVCLTSQLIKMAPADLILQDKGGLPGSNPATPSGPASLHGSERTSKATLPAFAISFLSTTWYRIKAVFPLSFYLSLTCLPSPPSPNPSSS